VRDVAAAARLVGYSARPRLTPVREPEYHELCLRYRDDSEFALTVREVADGLGLDLLDVTPRTGVVVAPRDESPFAMRLSRDYAPARAAEARLLHGLIHLSIAAFCFPRAADLQETDQVVRISARELDRYVRDLCEVIGNERDDVEPPVDLPELERAYRVYARRAQVGATPDDRRKYTATIPMCERALEWLCEHGLARVGPRSEEVGQIYLIGSRYRTLVRDMAGDALFEDVRALFDSGILTPHEGS
jgi:hypothetical protein